MDNEVIEKAERKLEELCRDTSLSKYLDPKFRIPKPYIGKGPINLIILGQDPTDPGCYLGGDISNGDYFGRGPDQDR